MCKLTVDGLPSATRRRRCDECSTAQASTYYQRHAVNALDDRGRDTPHSLCDDILDPAWKARSRRSDLAEICRSRWVCIAIPIKGS